jgi:hypothetical protein
MPTPVVTPSGVVVISLSLGGEGSFKFLPYQLGMVRYWLTMVVTGTRNKSSVSSGCQQWRPSKEGFDCGRGQT